MKGVSEKRMISFIIPAYNAEKTIGTTIQSIRTLPIDKEIIVVENGSVDGTRELLKKYQEIIVLNSEKGVSKARNKGINYAAGEWICFVDADDECLPGIKKASDEAERYQPDVLVASYLKDEDNILHNYKKSFVTGKVELEKAKEWMISKPTLRMQAWAKIYKKEFLLNNELRFNENLSFSEDSEFVIRVLNNVNTIVISNTTIYQYKSGTSSAMRSYSKDRIVEYIKALREAEKDVKSGPRAIRRAFRDYVITHLNIIAVHDIFGYDVDLRWGEKKQKMTELLKTDVIKRSVNTLTISDITSLNNLPALLFKYHLISLGGVICYFRSLQNKRRYQKAGVRQK